MKGQVKTPLKVEVWKRELSRHPDQQFAEYITAGIESGFRIGFNRAWPLKSATSNLPSSNPEVIKDHLEREVALGRMFRCSGKVQAQVSPLGVIPKRNKPGKWRLIVDLSSPKGRSVNDGVDPELSTLSYATVDHLAALAISQGPGALLVKADVKEAYRMVPVHPDDHHLLAVMWEGATYVDVALPFGLRLAPKIFSAVADAAQWIMAQRDIPHSLYYLDDFVLVSSEVEDAKRSRRVLESTFQELGIPLEPSKLEGPSTCLTFLGIEVDTIAQQLRLPAEKLARLQAELNRAMGRRSMTKRELQSLTGLLQHATKVVRPGRAFMRRLHVLQSVGSSPSHNVRLNVAARADIMWWHIFASHWNGVSMLWDLHGLPPNVKVLSDASGRWGCGALAMPNWLALAWPPELQDASIQVKELIPVVLAAALYGREWRGKVVQFVVDNLAVVEIIRATYSKEPHLMHLIRLLVFFASMFNF